MFHFIFIGGQKYRMNPQETLGAERELRAAGIESADVWTAPYSDAAAAKADGFAAAYKNGAIVHSHRTCERCGNHEAHRRKAIVRLVSGAPQLQCECTCSAEHWESEGLLPEHEPGCPRGACDDTLVDRELREREERENKARWGF